MNIFRKTYRYIFSLTGIGLLHIVHRQYEIGKYSYGVPVVHSWKGGASLNIGAFCSFAKDINILLGGEHRMDWVTTYPFYAFWREAKHITVHSSTKGNVIIGNDVWIGRGAVILSGVTIGDGATIGAYAVVAKNIPPYAVAVGNPARVVKMRFDEKTIQRLLAIKWWFWKREKLVSFLPYLLRNDVESFLERAEKEG